MRDHRVARPIYLAVVVSSLLVARPALAADAKVDLCHSTGQGRFHAISVSSKALSSHLSHGDVQQPNGAVPGDPGAVFDSACNPVSWVYRVNSAPDPSAVDPDSPGNLYAGSGIPAVNFGTATNTNAGVELGLMVLYRQGPTVPSSDTYADGILQFAVAGGPQSVVNGSQSNNANRAAWNYTFSVATGLNGATTNLNDFTFQLLIDLDPGPGTSYRVQTLEPGGSQSGFVWRDQISSIISIGDDEGNVNVTQNSQNYAFYQLLPPLSSSNYTVAGGFAGPGQFDVILQAYAGTQLIVRNHVLVNVAAVP